MGIDGDTFYNTERRTKNHRRRFSADTAKCEHVFHGARYLTLKLSDDGTTGLSYCASLHAIGAAGMNIALQFFLGNRQIVIRPFVFYKQSFTHLVHTSIRTLCGKNGCNK